MKNVKPLLELIVIFVWALFVTFPLANLNENIIPKGGDFSAAVSTNSFWIDVKKCGLCALWDGSMEGGAPALADVLSSKLHPIVAVFTLFLGTVNGAKLSLVFIFFLAGVSQWWLAKELNLGVVGRVWSSCMVIAAGHLSGKMEAGDYGLILSIVSSSFVYPAILKMHKEISNRSAVILGIVLALLFIAGQGYMQVGFILMLPTLIFLFPVNIKAFFQILKKYFLAILIMLLLSSIFLIPFFHFYPNFIKGMDNKFTYAQSFKNVLLNLVISDRSYYYGNNFKIFAAPSFYVNYVGWIPIIFALWGILEVTNPYKKRVILFLVTSGFISLWVASAYPMKIIAQFLPNHWITHVFSYIRYSSVISSLAVTPILGLSAIGVDRVMKTDKKHYQIRQYFCKNFITKNLIWYICVFFALIFSLQSAWIFGKSWIQTFHIYPDVSKIINALKTPDLQWVNTPIEQIFIEPATRAGLKLSNATKRWGWKDREKPQPLLEASRNGLSSGMFLREIREGVYISEAYSGREYAAVTHKDGSKTACQAFGIGANIDVFCTLKKPGILEVKENNWSGWNADIDNRSIIIKPEKWLSVDLNDGQHLLRFRYRPADFYYGISLTIIGIILCLWIAISDRTGKNIRLGYSKKS